MEFPQRPQPVRFHMDDEATGQSLPAVVSPDFTAELTAADATPAPDIMLSFHSLNIATRSPSAHLLTNITGYVRRGGVTGVVGASGSGKTLLMRALCGREPSVAVTGEVSLDGKQLDLRRPNHFGFVPQEVRTPSKVARNV
jgi:ABC-type protease/lipase transport system fused ATPase/permease subunit